MIFVDTNIFYYARDDRLPEKQDCCANWLIRLGTKQRGKANLQVANEFIHVVFRRMPHLPADEVFRMAEDILVWGNSVLSMATVAKARNLRVRYSFSWWDCLLLASALELGCSHFLSEDLQDGEQIDNGRGKGLTIVNPFAHSPEQILISR